MTEKDFRCQLRIKRAILEVHIATISETIDAMEDPNNDYTLAIDRYIDGETACFEKYLKIASEMK